MKGLNLLFFIVTFCNPLFSQEIKDHTKYYVKDIENFNNYSSNGWSLLDDKQLKVIAKALNIKKDEAEKIITSTSYYNHPKNKKNTDVAYIMYKICELNGYQNGGFKYPDNVLYLMYVPNDLNTHLPSDKLAENGKGFYQIALKECVSTTPLSPEYYKPSITLKNENYSFGFLFGPKGADSLVVLKVINSSPAEKAGFKINDIIIEFNGQNMKSESRLNATKILKESPFTNNVFKVLRNNTIQTISVDKVNAKTLEFVCISSNCDNGECVIEHINGYTIKGNCKDGNIIGNATFTTEDGFVFYEGPVKKLNSDFNKYNYVSHGLGKEKFRNGNSFEGNFVNGIKEGYGIYTYANGTQKKGIWKEGKYYDDISIGFPNERFRVATQRIYLHHLKNDFKANMVDVTDVEKKNAMSKYKLSESDIEKLFALCDMKYKPEHLNTPLKIRTVIEKNQKDHPYEAYFVAQIYGVDNETYYIIYLPTAYNRWLPQGVKFETQDGLYFCVPAFAVHFTDYYSYESMLAIQKGAEEQKKREQEQMELRTKHSDWAQKNKFKGVVIIQYINNQAQDFSEKYKYNVITIFGPPSRQVDDYDLNDLLDKYEFFYKNKGYKYLGINFHEGMDEVQAESKVYALTQTHKFGINANFNYTLPEKKTQTTSQSYKELQAKTDAAYKEVIKASKEIIEDKTIEKSAMRQQAIADAFSNKKSINNPAQVVVLDISTSDKYYSENKKFIGQTGTVEATLTENGDGTYYGTIQFSGEKYSTIFYNVKVKEVSVK